MLSSMTGFARAQASASWGVVQWELRSVNHRFLDVNIRLPDAIRVIEADLRKVMLEHFSRGKFDCTFICQYSSEASDLYQINEGLVKSLIQAAAQIKGENKELAPLDLSTIMTWPSVITKNNNQLENNIEIITQTFRQAVSKLAANRTQEGAELSSILLAKVEYLKDLIAKAQNNFLDSKKNVEEQLRTKLLNLKVEVEEKRFEQELVLYLNKMDVMEELERLDMHLNEVFRLISKGGVNGRRLDFLMQELNREANTLASKSVDVGLTQCSVEMKVVIEQMREQIQNIE